MSFYENQVIYDSYGNQINKQNNLLLYNSTNNLYQGTDQGYTILNQNLTNYNHNLPNSLNLTNNNSNYSSLTYVNNRTNSLNKNNDLNKNSQPINNGKIDREKRNLSSSGILKASRRSKKYDKVLKKGKKLKNIDVNRDYEDNPDDDISSNISVTKNIFKNKLASKDLNKNNLDQTMKNLSKNNNTNNINKSLNNIQEEKSEKTNKSKNDNNNKKSESDTKNSKNQLTVSKQKELNISSINPHPLPKSTIENNVYNISINTIPPLAPNLIDPYSNNFNSNINNFITYDKLLQINGIINQSFTGKGFKFCSQLSKAGKDINGLEKIDQDTPLIYTNVGGVEGFNMFGVLDGHGNDGHLVSQYCKNYFMSKMKEYVENLLIITPYLTAEDIYINLKSSGFSYIYDLFAIIDSELSSQNSFDYMLSGTTCDIIFQFNTHLVCFNVGDSRSILIEDFGDNTNQIIRPLSKDHKPELPEELQRIQLYGGTVERIKDIFGNEVGPSRVFKLGTGYPGLAMSRSLGDLQAKECGVISEPQIIEYEINSNTKFLVVCSDGIWDVLANEQVKDIGNNFYYNNDAEGFCKELVNIAVNNWSQKEIIRDDITAVTVFF